MPPDGSGRLVATPTIKRLRWVLVVVFAFLVFRALTSDDGTRDISAGQCVTAAASGDVRSVDCSDASAVGRVVHVARNAFTDDASVRRLCASHGSTRAFTSADASGGTGTVICVVDAR